jgi:hypothetical protein
VEQADVFSSVIEFFNSHSVAYAIVGSVAAISYGETRMTADMDVLASIEPRHVNALLQTFQSPDWYVSESAICDAIRNRRQFNIIHTSTGNKIDVIVRRTDEDTKALERAIRRPVTRTTEGFIANPNDVIAGKLRYYAEGESPKHLSDIASMLKVSQELIDTEELERRADEIGILPVWKAILERVRSAPPLPPGFPGAPES